MNNYTLDDISIDNQKGYLGFSAFIIVLFGACFIFDFHFYVGLILAIVILLLWLGFKFYADFYNVKIQEKMFVIEHIFKPVQRLDIDLFDRIEGMQTVFWLPGTSYFTICFKDGRRFNFCSIKYKGFKYQLTSKEEISKKLTAEVVHMVNNY
ncbi:hypothetical protein [Chitinophaga sp. Cy-1792]|uniref:hypothetical protein n=1 Tax=Chitinophaga sp. Cy-1792 TaxID=2608339 RepID=UPI00141FCCB1|nr:hypothetical protein [Chitinophaga sp. Cy-1792]NIG53542.1 hypothetical protein [Chitinophaga sp. Cy-1792]